MAQSPIYPPFDVSVHLNSPPPEKPNAVVELRSALYSSAVYTAIVSTYPEACAWCTDQQLTRFLIARSFNVAAALKLLLSALEWRSRRKPELVERMPGFEQTFGKQGATGKVYCPGTDRWAGCLARTALGSRHTPAQRSARPVRGCASAPPSPPSLPDDAHAERGPV